MLPYCEIVWRGDETMEHNFSMMSISILDLSNICNTNILKIDLLGLKY